MQAQEHMDLLSSLARALTSLSGFSKSATDHRLWWFVYLLFHSTLLILEVYDYGASGRSNKIVINTKLKGLSVNDGRIYANSKSCLAEKGMHRLDRCLL